MTLIHKKLEIIEKDLGDLQISLLLADAGRGIREPFTVRNRFLRMLLLAWLKLWGKLGRAGQWITFRLWKRRLINRGRARWRLMAEIGRKDSSFPLRPEKIGYIDYPILVSVKNRVFRDYIERSRPPKPDFE